MSNKGTSSKDLLNEDNLSAKLKDISFEDGLRLLEDLVEKVESGDLPLDKSIVSYEKGVALIEHLRKQLSGAEAKLKVLQKGGGAS